jgi:ligand-binding SRPBCC domain-containing protein
VFTLFADPRSLDLVTPPWFRLSPLGRIPDRLERGLEISYRLRWRGLPFRWTSLITDWQEPGFFAYEQKEGPYRFFRHEHFFDAVDGGTEILDRVVYRAPGGPLADRLVAGPDLRRIFAFRARRAQALFDSSQAEPGGELSASRMPWTSAASSAIERPT